MHQGLRPIQGRRSSRQLGILPVSKPSSLTTFSNVVAIHFESVVLLINVDVGALNLKLFGSL
jgi:hypothetical protein